MSKDPLIFKKDSKLFSADYDADKKNISKPLLKVLYHFFKLVRAIYTSVYFYFFPLSITLIPAIFLLIVKEHEVVHYSCIKPKIELFWK